MRFVTQGLRGELVRQLEIFDAVHWVVYGSDPNGWERLRGPVGSFLRRGTTTFKLTLHWDGVCLAPRTAVHLAGVLKDLQFAGARAEVHLWHPGEGLMHAKVYAAASGGRVRDVVVGSSNLSEGGLDRNVEASLVIDEGAGLPEGSITAFLNAALSQVRVTLDNLESMRCPEPPEPPPPPFAFLTIGHPRDTFPMSRLFMTPAEYGLGAGGPRSVQGGRLRWERREYLSFDLLDLVPSDLAKPLKSVRSRVNPAKAQWILRGRCLQLSLGLVIPNRNLPGIRDDMAREIKKLRRAAKMIERLDPRDRRKQLHSWCRDLVTEFGLTRRRTKEVVDALTDDLVARTDAAWPHLCKMSVALVEHPVPDFHHESTRLDFENEMVVALAGRIAKVAGYKNSDAARARKVRALRVLAEAVRSKTLDAKIERLAKARTLHQRLTVGESARRYQLQRQGWFSLPLVRKRSNVESDRAPSR